MNGFKPGIFFCAYYKPGPGFLYVVQRFFFIDLKCKVGVRLVILVELLTITV
jgi:hypothetical protein